MITYRKGVKSLEIVKTRSLTKIYGSKHKGAIVKALNGMDLDVKKGEFVSIMGPSGSGKTTLLNLLAGLDRPTSGELRIDGRDIVTMPRDDLALFRRRGLGFVFQDFHLLDTLTLEENVALPLALDGHKGKAVLQRVHDVMEYLGLQDVMKRYPYEVSGGQQQRTAVARAIVHEPALILADEPTGNLDSASSRALLEVFQRLNEELHSTILMVTHDPFAASYSRRIVFIKDGQIFCELERTGPRPQFFQEILDTLAVLEGSDHGLATSRI
jgi:ABC-type lipoprotein export system ATPase subunit